MCEAIGGGGAVSPPAQEAVPDVSVGNAGSKDAVVPNGDHRGLKKSMPKTYFSLLVKTFLDLCVKY